MQILVLDCYIALYHHALKKCEVRLIRPLYGHNLSSLQKLGTHATSLLLILLSTSNVQLPILLTTSIDVQHHAPSRPDHLPTLSAAKTSELSLLVKSPFWRRSGRCRQCGFDFLLQCAGDIEADHTDSGIAMDCAVRNREAPHFGA